MDEPTKPSVKAAEPRRDESPAPRASIGGRLWPIPMSPPISALVTMSDSRPGAAALREPDQPQASHDDRCDAADRRAAGNAGPQGRGQGYEYDGHRRRQPHLGEADTQVAGHAGREGSDDDESGAHRRGSHEDS